MKTAILLLTTVAITASADTLWNEAMEFLEILLSQGYRVGGVTEVEVSYLEPCTLSANTGLLADRSGGYLIAMGGNHILDLELKLQGNGWFLRDTMPDDLPVLEVDSQQVATARLIILQALDMTHCSLQDSVVVMWALLPVDPDR